MATLLRSASCAVLLLPSLGFAGVLRVAPTGAPYTTPQAAIDAALDGDVVLIAPGTYPGFTITNKALAVGVDPQGTVQCGRARVINLAASKNVVLQDLSLRPGYSDSAVELASDAGSVRIQACTLLGGWAIPWSAAGIGLSVIASDDVVLRACSVTGGNGFSDFYATGRGAQGVYVQGSRVALYGCTVTGGGGGWAQTGSAVDGGDGGHGLETPDSFVLSERTTIRGGYGANGADGDLWIGGGDGGDGGHGVVLQSASPAPLPRLVARQSTFFGGMAGMPGYMGISPGMAGLPTYVTVGAVVNAAQTDVVEVEALAQWQFGANVPVTVRAAPGSMLVLRSGTDTDFAWNATSEYARHVPDPCRRLLVGPIPPSGSLTIPFIGPAAGSGVQATVRFYQVEQLSPTPGPAGAPACVILR